MTVRGEFLLRLERGAEVLEALKDFCEKRGIGSAVFSALGAIEAAKVGYYDLESKKYGSLEYHEPMEVASLTGNIAQVDGRPFVHAHVVLSDTKNNCFGGHLFAGRVAVTLEIHMRAFDEQIPRILDEKIGLNLLDL